jgi:hypothetical protein
MMVLIVYIENPIKLLDYMDELERYDDFDFGVSNQYSTNFFSKHNNFKI